MKVILGNNIEVLKQYPDNYFDSIVTDPPYGLGKEPDALELMKDWIEKGYHEIKGTGFMGKEWDSFVPQPIFWKEVFRVLKHGGHVVSFFGARTYDWGVMAMRFAGFEIRDFISWTYGSGFPKALDVSKSIDKMYGAEREILGINGTRPIQTSGRINSEASSKEKFEREENYITNPSTDLGKKWDGWKTAIKPAHEPIVLARKPIEKGLTISENVIKYGTGALNIDATRVSTNGETWERKNNVEYRIKNNIPSTKSMLSNGNGAYVNSNPNGRFPANFILTHSPECKTIDNINFECIDGCPIKELDNQSGLLKSGAMKKSYEYQNNGFSLGKPTGSTKQIHEANEGGASRFFLNTSFEEADYDIFKYVGKASKSERNKGLEGEKWFYNLQLVTEFCSFTEQNLFIWQKEEQNQSTDLNGEAQQQKVISEDMMLIVEGKECNTILNGKSTMVLFPKNIKFTTKMGLNQIIELRTLNYYQPLNINDCIVDVLETNKANGLNLAENVGIKNLLKLIFTKDEMGFPLGVKLVAKKTLKSINVKDAWQKINIHSTVKPIEIMRYLVKLVTPPKGIVLDPFCGSGTTGIAAKLEGFDFIGIEQEEEYYNIANARIENYTERVNIQFEEPNKEQLSLF
jgi:site-specific DNA-methyltransferase (adenine-specific)